jgi:hypothetical protein
MLAVFNRFDKAWEEAARDLGATSWQSFWHVVLPIVAPSVIGIALFGFTLSFDEFARTLLTAGTDNTLPLEILGMTTTVTTPVLYALGTASTALSFLVISVALLGLWRAKKTARMMANFLCVTCGTQHAETEALPERCLICADERQYVPAAGQRWTTLEAMRKTLAATFRHDAGVLGIGTAPSFGIGQRALLVRTPLGNVLWDCISLIDDAMVELIQGLGGIQAIAISHPHYYTSMVEWSRRFGGITVYLHAADRQWVMRPDDCVHLLGGRDEGDPARASPLIRAGAGIMPAARCCIWARGGPEDRVTRCAADRRHPPSRGSRRDSNPISASKCASYPNLH